MNGRGEKGRVVAEILKVVTKKANLKI